MSNEGGIRFQNLPRETNVELMTNSLRAFKGNRAIGFEMVDFAKSCLPFKEKGSRRDRPTRKQPELFNILL
jgi:hypothetical protein